MALTNITGQFNAGVASFESDTFENSELFSGHTPPVAWLTGENVGQNTDLPAFSVVGRTGNAVGGALVLATFVGAEIGDAGGAVASGALTFSAAGTAGDTVTIGTTVYTLRAVPAVAGDVLLGASAAASATNLAAAVNGDDAFNDPHPTVNATVSGAVVTVRANAPGTAGNAIVTTEAGTGTSFGAATLAGGTDVAGGGIVPIGILPTPLLTGTGVVTTTDVICAGCFNPDALNWDASFNTEAKKKQAFFGSPTPTNITILKPLYGAVLP